jgi:hypothetical protein
LTIGEILSYAILALLLLGTAVLCERQSAELGSIDSRLAVLEDRAYTSLPRISIARGRSMPAARLS